MKRRRRPTATTTAKLGRDTVQMLRDIAKPRWATLDDVIWQLAERVRGAALPGIAGDGIPLDRAVYRKRAEALDAGGASKLA